MNTESSEPLVSVMMPCFNAQRTLPMALASLKAQTYQNWEAVVVDDASDDRTWDMLQGFDDPRVRRERSTANRGIGAVRQRCLEMARGQLLSFLDSDDWLFPDKLERQVATMREHPELTVLSGSCVIIDGRGEPVGMFRAGPAPHRGFRTGRLTRPGQLPLSFPPAIVRMEAARQAGFNSRFRRSEDSNFLIRVMLGRTYGISQVPVYAYSQAESASLAKTLEGYRFRLHSYREFGRSHPVSSRVEIAKTVLKIGVYKTAGWLGLAGGLIESRSESLTPEGKAAYEIARATVAKLA
ncbi:MAG: glycosyltransferase family 2 protein [Elusimicrobiota bacterium]